MAKTRPESSHCEVLDPLDLALIAQLQKDGRTPLTELGERLNVSHGTVRNRLERLLAQEVLKITAVVDPAKVGFPTQVYIGINTDLSQVEAVEKQVPEFEEIIYFSTMSGRLDFLAGAAFASDAYLREFLFRKLSSVKGIRSTETFHILNQGKRVWQWRIPRLHNYE